MRYQNSKRNQTDSYSEAVTDLFSNPNLHLEEEYDIVLNENYLDSPWLHLTYEPQKLLGKNVDTRNRKNEMKENTNPPLHSDSQQSFKLESSPTDTQSQGIAKSGSILKDSGSKRINGRSILRGRSHKDSGSTSVIVTGPSRNLLEPLKIASQYDNWLYHSNSSNASSPSPRLDSTTHVSVAFNGTPTVSKSEIASFNSEFVTGKQFLPTQKGDQRAQRIHSYPINDENIRLHPSILSKFGSSPRSVLLNIRPQIPNVISNQSQPQSWVQRRERLKIPINPDSRRTGSILQKFPPLRASMPRNYNLSTIGKRRTAIPTESPQKNAVDQTVERTGKNFALDASEKFSRTSRGNSRARHSNNLIGQNNIHKQELLTLSSMQTIDPIIGSRVTGRKFRKKFETDVRPPSGYSFRSNVISNFSNPTENESTNTQKSQLNGVTSDINRKSRIAGISKAKTNLGDTHQSFLDRNGMDKLISTEKSETNLGNTHRKPLSYFHSHLKQTTAASNILDNVRTGFQVTTPKQSTRPLPNLKAKHRTSLEGYQDNEKDPDSNYVNDHRIQYWMPCDDKISNMTHEIDCRRNLNGNHKCDIYSKKCAPESSDVIPRKLTRTQQKIRITTNDPPRHMILDSSRLDRKQLLQEDLENVDIHLETNQVPDKMSPTENQTIKNENDSNLSQSQDSHQTGAQTTLKPDIIIEDLIEGAGNQHNMHHEPKEVDSGKDSSGKGHWSKRSEDGETENTGYKAFHEHDKAEKGYHDKEDHEHHYDEKEGEDKEHSEEAKYYKEYEKHEEGEKDSSYKEEGKYNKGHNTKGVHVIHKKDEIDKKTEFFDDFDDDGEWKQKGGFHQESEHEKGGHFHKGYKFAGHNEIKHGEKGHHYKGHHHHDDKGHKEQEGSRHRHNQKERHGKAKIRGSIKHWDKKNGL